MSDETAKITQRLPFIEEKPVICSVTSRIADEQLFGTASKTLVWFLLEYPYPFGAKAFEESSLPQPVKEHLSWLVKVTQDSRLLLVKQKTGLPADGFRFFIVIGREQAPAIYEFHFPDYEALLSLDSSKVLSDEPAFQEHRRQQPLYLICTNGRRDPCCARWGQPVFDEITGHMGESVWQCSHVGGHRFAANVLCFPHGIYYGRVDRGEITNLLGAYPRGLITLANYRGRACYPPEAQAAEFFLRSQTGTSQVEAFRLVFIKKTGPGFWEIHFQSPQDGKTFNLRMASEQSDYQIYESCRSTEPAYQTQYRLIQFEEAGGL